MASYIIDVVESSPSALEKIRGSLQETKFHVREFSKASQFLSNFEMNPPDLAIVDLRLYDDYGVNLLKMIRASEGEKRDTRVILVGENSALDDRCGAYNAGADGFLEIPFEGEELSAMASALMRRVRKRKEVVRWGPFILDKIEREARRLNQVLNLTNCEFLIYQMLMEAQGSIVGREALYRSFGDPHKPYDPHSKALDMHIKSLRDKLGDDGRCIESVYGGGYRLAD